MSTEKFPAINPYSQIYSNPYAAKSTKNSQMAEFSQLLMSMFSSSFNSGFGESTGSFPGQENSSSMKSSLDSMMMPLMLSLLEKIQSFDLDAETAPGSEAATVRRPVGAARVTQGYNGSHHALDFGVVEGTPVKTTMSGNVVYAGWNDQGYGNLVIVENGSRRTYYAHLSELPVAVGEKVTQGDVIGLSGNTGNSTGPHLHYEVRVNGQTINPSEEVFGNNPVV